MTDYTEGDVPLDRDPSPEEEARELFESHEDREKRLRNEGLAQDIRERRKYARRSFNLTCVWIGFIILSTVAQFSLNAYQRGLDRYQFITLITTTTATVLGFWLLVGRYLFPVSPSSESPRATRSRRGQGPSGE